VRLAIIQSCYVPWKGFFDLIGRCNEYVIFDSAQYVKGHWHNRNRIKTERGLEWLTIPVKRRFPEPIEQVEIERPWAEKHWRSIELAYRRAPFFEMFAPAVQGWYELAEKETRLTEINILFLRELARLLGLPTRMVRDTAYAATGIRTERLISICRAAGADCYVSGPSAKAYLQEDQFAAAGISLEWMNYEGYPEYTQLHGGFEHAVTVLDLIFNTGPNASSYLCARGARSACCLS